MTLAGFAVCAHTFVRINLYAQDHTLLFPRSNMNGLAARTFERMSALVLALWSRVLVLVL